MFTDTIHPRFSETNAAGHIGFTALPAWFEKALEDIYRLFIPHLDPEQWTLIVVKFEMECLAEINHRDEVIINTSIDRIGNSSLHVLQELHQGGQKKVLARTVLVHFDYSLHKSQTIDDSTRATLARHLITESPGDR